MHAGHDRIPAKAETLRCRPARLQQTPLYSGGKRRLAGTDNALLYAAVSGHLVLFASQRRALDLLLAGLIDRAASMASFERAYPWLRVRGNGRVDSGESLLRELRWSAPRDA